MLGLVGEIYFSRNYFFFQDDFIFLYEAKYSKLNLNYLKEPVFLHFSPMYRLINKVFYHFFAMNFGDAHVIEILIWVSVVVSFSWSISVLIKNRIVWATLILFFCQSIVLVHLASWWTAASNILISYPFSLLFLGAYFRYRLKSQIYQGWLSILWYLISVFIHEQTWIVFGFILLIDVFLFSGNLTVLQLIRKRISYYLLLTLITLGAVINYFFNYYQKTQSAGIGELLKYFWLQFSLSFLPSVTGIHPFAQTQSSDVIYAKFPWIILLSVISNLIITLFVVVFLIARYRKTARIWLIFLVAYLVNSVPIGIARVGLFGPGFGLTADYIGNMVYFFFISVALSIYLIDQKFETRQHSLKRKKILIAVSLVLFLVMEPIHFYSLSLQDSKDFEFSEAMISREFVSNYITNLKDLKSGTYSILDTTVPDSVLGSVFYPYNNLDHISSLYNLNVSYNSLASNVYETNAEGRLILVNYQPLADPLSNSGLMTLKAEGAICSGYKEQRYMQRISANSDIWLYFKAQATGQTYKDMVINVSYYLPEESRPGFQTFVISANPYGQLLNLNSNSMTDMRITVQSTTSGICISQGSLGYFSPSRLNTL
jgi:hypothetical protein